MTDWDRLTDYIMDFFPDPSYSTQDIKDWAQDNVPAWKSMPSDAKKGVLNDWEDFIQPQVETGLRATLKGYSRRFIGRIRAFLGRLF